MKWNKNILREGVLFPRICKLLQKKISFLWMKNFTFLALWRCNLVLTEKRSRVKNGEKGGRNITDSLQEKIHFFCHNMKRTKCGGRDFSSCFRETLSRFRVLLQNEFISKVFWGNLSSYKIIFHSANGS